MNCVYEEYTDVLQYINSFEEAKRIEKLYKQLFIARRKEQQQRTMKQWWLKGFKAKTNLYHKPQPSRVVVYKVLTCNRRGLGLRNRLRR